MSEFQNQNQYYNSAFPNVFAQGLASPITSQGRFMGSIGEGPPLAGFLGVTDPGMSVALNTILQPLLASFVGGKYVPAQFSSGMNMYSQMRAGSVLNNQSKSMGMASKMDQRAIYEMIEGSANLLGQPMGRRERQNANDVASFAATMLPTLAQMNPDLVDKMGGVKGSATVMAQNMYRGGRYAIDPVTGRRGYSAESSAEITKGVYDRLYSGDPSAMGGMTAGRAGALFDEAQRRGMMPNSSGRGKGMKEIADQMGTTISEVSQMPDLDRKLRELDANKIADKLKGMSKAVNAMSEIFGEAGEPNAPMAQLVGAIETLTQANMQNMEPHKLERMVRNTANVAKSAGIEMPEMFKLMGATAGMADRAGVNRAFVPGITSQAVAENQAGKNIFGGVKVFGMPNADKLLNIDQQLNVQATRDYRTQDIASIARAVETFGVEPERGSELSAVYDAIKNKDSGGDYTYAGEKKNVYDLNKRRGGINQFLAGNKVPISVIQSLNANREANEAFIDKYNINTNIARPGQTNLVTDELSMYNGVALKSAMKDEALMSDASPELKAVLNSSAKEITRQTAEGLFADNLNAEDINDINGLTERNLTKVLEDKGVKLTDADKKVVKTMAGAITTSSDSYARNQGKFDNLATMAVSLNKGKIREARALQADADITSQFEEGFGGMGKSSFLQRTTDFLRGAGKDTKVEDFMASALNFQPTKQIEALFAKDFDNLQKSALAFKGASGTEVKLDYLKNAITINADEMSKAKDDPEKLKKLEAERNNLKEDLVRGGFTKTADLTKDYDKMIGRKPEEIEKARKEKDDFKNKHGVTFDEAKTLNPLELQTRQRASLLAQYKEIAERLNIRMDNSGLMVGEVSGDKAANQTVQYLEKGTIGGVNYGIDLAKNYIENFGLDSAAVSKAGVEGNAAKERAQESILRIDSYAKALGLQQGELLNGKYAEGGLPPHINIAQLKTETDREVTGLESLQAQTNNPDKFAGVINTFKQQAEGLKAKAVDPKETEAQKGARTREINRLEDLSKTTKENLSSKLTAAKKTQDSLKEEPLKALAASFEVYKKTHDDQIEHKNIVDAFIEEVGTRTKVAGRSLAQIAGPDAEALELVRSLREDKFKIKGFSIEDTKAKKEIDAKISAAMGGMDESKFKGLEGKDYDEAVALVDKYKDLTPSEKKDLDELKTTVKIPNNLTPAEKARLQKYEASAGPLSPKDEDDRTTLLGKKAKAEDALKDPKRKQYEELLARDTKTYTPEDKAKLDRYAAISGMKVEDLKGLTDWKKDSAERMKGLSAEDKKKAIELEKKGKDLKVKKLEAAAKFDNFSPQAVAAIMGAGSDKGKNSYFSLLLDDEAQSLINSFKEMGTATTIGGKTELSESQKKAIGQAAKLQAGDTKTALNFFENELNLPGMAKKPGSKAGALEAEIFAHEKAAREVGKELTLGLEGAVRHAPGSDGKVKSPAEQMAALGKLLSRPDEEGLTEGEKKTRKTMLDKGFKNIIGKDNKVDEVELMKLFKKTETTIAEKNALDPDKGKDGKDLKVSFKDGQEFKLTGVLGLETKLMAGTITSRNDLF